MFPLRSELAITFTIRVPRCCAEHHTYPAPLRQSLRTPARTRAGAPPDMAPNASPYTDRRPFLLGRARIISGLREHFAAQGFVELETSALVASPGNETHLHAFATEWITPAGARERLYLRTSPEFACKRMLALGEPRVVEFARSFRNREQGVLHQPEFTMLEWYRANEP